MSKDWKVYCDAGSNHNGSLDRALQMVAAVGELNRTIAGGGHFPGIKFQIFREVTLWDPDNKHAPAPGVIAKNEVCLSWIPQLLIAGKQEGVEIGFTVFDEDLLDGVSQFTPSIFYKVSSFDILRLDYLKKVAALAVGSSRPLHISFGGASPDEIRAALSAILVAEPGLPLYVYHCVSEYPTLPERARLNEIMNLSLIVADFRKDSDIKIGWSDHTKNIGVILRALSYATEVIELHLDLPDNLGGEAAHGHCWNTEELKTLGEVVHGYCASASPVRRIVSAPDLRADPSDGRRPLLAHRKCKVPAYSAETLKSQRKRRENEIWEEYKKSREKSYEQ